MHLNEVTVKNNYVAKNDFNRSSIHKDLKNDYNRSVNDSLISEGVDDYLTDEDSILDLARSIAIEEYARVK